MKNLVIKTEDLLKVLKKLETDATALQANVLDEEAAKKRTMDALNGSPGDRILSMKTMLDSIKLEGYIKGVTFATQQLAKMVEESVKASGEQSGTV